MLKEKILAIVVTLIFMIPAGVFITGNISDYQSENAEIKDETMLDNSKNQATDKIAKFWKSWIIMEGLFVYFILTDDARHYYNDYSLESASPPSAEAEIAISQDMTDNPEIWKNLSSEEAFKRMTMIYNRVQMEQETQNKAKFDN